MWIWSVYCSSLQSSNNRGSVGMRLRLVNDQNEQQIESETYWKRKQESESGKRKEKKRSEMKGRQVKEGKGRGKVKKMREKSSRWRHLLSVFSFVFPSFVPFSSFFFLFLPFSSFSFLFLPFPSFSFLFLPFSFVFVQFCLLAGQNFKNFSPAAGLCTFSRFYQKTQKFSSRFARRPQPLRSLTLRRAYSFNNGDKERRKNWSD